jgi:hypothetical protein
MWEKRRKKRRDERDERESDERDAGEEEKTQKTKECTGSGRDTQRFVDVRASALFVSSDESARVTRAFDETQIRACFGFAQKRERETFARR